VGEKPAENRQKQMPQNGTRKRGFPLAAQLLLGINRLLMFEFFRQKTLSNSTKYFRLVIFTVQRGNTDENMLLP